MPNFLLACLDWALTKLLGFNPLFSIVIITTLQIVSSVMANVKWNFLLPSSSKPTQPQLSLVWVSTICPTQALAPSKQGWVSSIFTWRLSVHPWVCPCVRLASHSLAEPPSNLESWNLAQVSALGGRWKSHSFFVTAVISCQKMSTSVDSW